MSYRRTLCATNLAAVGTGFGLYSTDNNRALPCLQTADRGNWLRPEAGGHTNTANLLPLLNAKYLPPERLICAGRGLPDNAAAVPTGSDIQNCGYSYVNLFGSEHPTWNGSEATIVLADRNLALHGVRRAAAMKTPSITGKRATMCCGRMATRAGNCRRTSARRTTTSGRWAADRTD